MDPPTGAVGAVVAIVALPAGVSAQVSSRCGSDAGVHPVIQVARTRHRGGGYAAACRIRAVAADSQGDDQYRHERAS